MRLDGKCNGKENKCIARAVYADNYIPGDRRVRLIPNTINRVVDKTIGGRKRKLKKSKNHSKKVKKIK